MYNIGLQVLRAKLRGFHAAGNSISCRIYKSTKERKSKLWNAKRKLGVHCRHHLIAYGFLRGVPYNQIERCAPNNKPDAQVILDIMLAHADGRQREELSLEKVQSLLFTSEPETFTIADAPARVVSNEQMNSVPSTPRTIGQLINTKLGKVTPLVARKKA